MRDWLALGRVDEIENPGDYMTFRVLDEPVIICRDNDGNINAFANVCAHRGVEVANGAGNLQEFSCLYHGWLYDLEGKLIGAPYMKEAEGFDPANCRLNHCARAFGPAGSSSILTTPQRCSKNTFGFSTTHSASSAWRIAASTASMSPTSIATGSSLTKI